MSSDTSRTKTVHDQAPVRRGIFTSDVVLRHQARRPELTVEALAPGLWTVTDGKLRTVFAEGRTSVVAVDTFGTPGAAAEYREAIAATVPDKPIGTLICSHDHLEHSGYGEVLAPGVTVVAHEATAAVIELRGADGQSAVSRPILGDGERVELDGVDVGLSFPGHTHGTGNLAVHFPAAGVLYMADTALSNARYGFFPDYHLGNYVTSMRRLVDGDLAFDRFVPGRYDVMGRADVGAAVDYVEAFMEACQLAYADPAVMVWDINSVGAYVAERLRPRFGGLEAFDANVPLGSLRVIHHYLMGGWGLEDTPAGGWNLFEPAGRAA